MATIVVVGKETGDNEGRNVDNLENSRKSKRKEGSMYFSNFLSFYESIYQKA